ncbi:MAG: transporter substrate-binding domain-containing protein [Magnetococcales bacterium]|nr:transporter substrate-binding domain-containing protein [Magnetococcales bacterium]
MSRKESKIWLGIMALVLLLTGPGPGVIGYARAETVKVAVSISIPPFFIKEIDSGIEMEIIRQAFKRGGHEVLPVFFRAGPRITSYQDGKVACASTVTTESGLKGVYSDPVITMETVAISLASRGLTIQNIQDLSHLNIIAFKGAKNILGAQFVNAIQNNLHYRERLKNEIQPVLLYRKRVDVVLSDGMIFQYYRNKMAERVDVTQPITAHHIFPPQNFSLICHDPLLIDAFNRGLAQIKASGLYGRIHDRFTREIFDQRLENREEPR